MSKTRLKALIKLNNLCPTSDTVHTILKETVKLIDHDLTQKDTTHEEIRLLNKYKSMFSSVDELPFLLDSIENRLFMFIKLYVSCDYKIMLVDEIINNFYEDGQNGYRDFKETISLVINFNHWLKNVDVLQKELKMQQEQIDDKMTSIKGVDITAQKGTSSKSRSEVITNLIYKKDKVQELINVNNAYIELLKERKQKAYDIIYLLDVESKNQIMNISQCDDEERKQLFIYEELENIYIKNCQNLMKKEKA